MISRAIPPYSFEFSTLSIFKIWKSNWIPSTLCEFIDGGMHSKAYRVCLQNPQKTDKHFYFAFDARKLQNIDSWITRWRYVLSNKVVNLPQFYIMELFEILQLKLCFECFVSFWVIYMLNIDFYFAATYTCIADAL